MKVGDLVRFVGNGSLGIVTEIIDEFLVGVWWTNSEHIYMESVTNLEVANAAG